MAITRNETIKVNEPLMRKLIREYCIKRLESREFPDDLDDDTDMFEAGIIDSIDALELLIGFEEDYGVVIPEDLQDVSDLGSIAGICRFLIENVDIRALEEKLRTKIILN